MLISIYEKIKHKWGKIMKPKVSVIIPVYNVERQLSRCVNSVVSQSLREIEIILVDDGSPDMCPQICDEYKEKDKRVKVIHKTNGGLSDARNVGLNIATGEYILFLDSDDWIEEIMLERLYHRIDTDRSDIVVCAYTIDYPNNNFCIKKEIPTLVSYTDNIADSIYNLDSNGMFNVVWNKLYRHDLLKENNFSFEIDGVPGEDLLFNCAVFKKVKRVSYEYEILHHYMKEDEDTLVHSYKSNLYSQVQRFNCARKTLYDFYNMISVEEMICYANSYVGYISTCVPNIFRENCDLLTKEKIYFFRKILKSEELQNYMVISSKEGVYDKLFYVMIKSNNSIFMYSVYSTLFMIRNSFEGFYRRVRMGILS